MSSSSLPAQSLVKKTEHYEALWERQVWFERNELAYSFQAVAQQLRVVSFLCTLAINTLLLAGGYTTMDASYNSSPKPWVNTMMYWLPFIHVVTCSTTFVLFYLQVSACIQCHIMATGTQHGVPRLFG